MNIAVLIGVLGEYQSAIVTGVCGNYSQFNEHCLDFIEL